MILDLFFLVARTNFFEDIALPAIVGGAVLLWIGNTIMKQVTGYYLW